MAEAAENTPLSCASSIYRFTGSDRKFTLCVEVVYAESDAVLFVNSSNRRDLYAPLISFKASASPKYRQRAVEGKLVINLISVLDSAPNELYEVNWYRLLITSFLMNSSI